MKWLCRAGFLCRDTLGRYGRTMAIHIGVKIDVGIHTLEIACEVTKMMSRKFFFRICTEMIFFNCF